MTWGNAEICFVWFAVFKSSVAIFQRKQRFFFLVLNQWHGFMFAIISDPQICISKKFKHYFTGSGGFSLGFHPFSPSYSLSLSVLHSRGLLLGYSQCHWLFLLPCLFCYWAHPGNFPQHFRHCTFMFLTFLSLFLSFLRLSFLCCEYVTSFPEAQLQ